MFFNIFLQEKPDVNLSLALIKIKRDEEDEKRRLEFEGEVIFLKLL